MESWFREHIDPHILTVLLVWLMMGMMLTMGTADLAGQVLAGRYRLLHALGAGAGGRTYVAQDTQLGRRVAVKVLHEALAGDVTFLARFRAEARAVASLSHPNIVTLHDWGDGPVPFMVLELLGGGSLAALLASGRRLSAAQAARLGSDVAAGLEHAHGQGLVHRDVKPGNLLLDDRGTVKIADFGLARALAESGATEPAGGVVGTARYVAPEQATADPLDGRADLYALGLVLVEAVTGEVPLTGETPIATLLMRAATPIEAPVELGALGVAVERAGLPTPVERYSDAAAMGRALAAAATMLPEPEPLELPGLGVDLDEPVPTEIVVTRRPDRPTEALVAEELGDTGEQALGLADDAAPADAAPAAEHRRGRLLVPWVVGVVAGLAFAGAAWAVTEARGPLAHAPNVVGATEDDAAAALTRSGLSLDVVERVHAPDPAGTVLSQDPTAGGTLRRGGDVELVVSSGAPPVALPAVTGQEEGPAVEALAAAGFEVAVEHRYDDGVPAGAVILQEPSASEAPEGSAVTIVVSRGPEPVVLPNVVGKPREAAVAALDEARFNVVAVEEFSDTVDAGSVIRQDPVGGAEAVPGSQVKIVVSKGPNRVLIPDVKGLTVEEATRKIEAAGLKADVIGYKPGGLVKRQDPEGGLMLERGRTVTLFV